MATKSSAKLSIDRYMKLLRRFPPLPIQSEAELDRAIEVMDTLLDKPRSAEEEAFLGMLAIFVERYEDQAYPIKQMPDHVMLSHLLEARGMEPSQLADECGISQSAIAAVLSGSRKLTRGQIAKLARYFSVSPAVFEFAG